MASCYPLPPPNPDIHPHTDTPTAAKIVEIGIGSDRFRIPVFFNGRSGKKISESKKSFKVGPENSLPRLDPGEAVEHYDIKGALMFIKSNKVLIAISLAMVLFAGCSHRPLAEILTNSDGKTFISLHTPHLRHQLDMGGPGGAFWYEDNIGRHWIDGVPAKESGSTESFEATWQIDGREVTFSLAGEQGQYRYAFTATPNADILEWGFGLSAAPEEYFTGLFERTVDGDQRESWKSGIQTAMNLRGQKVDMLIKPTLSLYTPFYLSSANYGLFTEGTWPGHYDFCKTDSARVQVSFEGPELTGILYTGTHPAEIVKAHSLYTGPTFVPPKWAFLPWRWRDNHVNLPAYYDGTPADVPYNSQVVEDILMMEALDIPCGIYWVDRPWAKGTHGYEDFDWDPKRFPQAVEMIDWIHGRDMRFILWIAPWVAGEMRNEANTNGYTLPMKAVPWGLDESNVALLDFTHPDACAWWQEKGIEKMLREGVDGFKLDRSEELVPETRDVIVADGRTAREVRNEYPVLYVKTVNESCAKLKGDDFVLIPRAGYTGSAKYSGFWGGDIGSPAEGLRAAVIALQRSAIIGFPVWGSDIGGYWGGELDREVCARWLAFGCFCPIMEFGPTEDRAPWSMKSEPHYDTTLIAIWRLYASLHARLASYSYEHTVEAHNTGMPVVRPLFLQFPEQPDAWNDWHTFFYGSDLLVSAIWEKGKTSHRLYLPAGTRWIDAWDTAQSHAGGQWLEVEVPLYRIPIFVREGSQLDLGDLKTLYRESLEIASSPPDMKQLENRAFRN
jgi:alpha-D-xyloside xylohydrolase